MAIKARSTFESSLFKIERLIQLMKYYNTRSKAQKARQRHGKLTLNHMPTEVLLEVAKHVVVETSQPGLELTNLFNAVGRVIKKTRGFVWGQVAWKDVRRNMDWARHMENRREEMRRRNLRWACTWGYKLLE